MPGVPPDAVNTLKRAFKGLFKRGKKSKQDAETPQQEQTLPSTSAGNAVPPPTASEESSSPIPTTAAVAPQLPPVQSSSPLQSPSEDLSKPLPPTHPLSTGYQSQPQEAVPINRNAEPGPPETETRLSPIDTAELVRRHQDAEQAESSTVPPISSTAPRIPVDTSTPIGEQSAASPLVSSTATDGAKDDVTPSIGNSAGLASPQTTNEYINVASANENTSAAPPAKTDSGVGPLNGGQSAITYATSENTHPSTNGVAASAAANDEKVAVMQDEPPPIKSVQAAPGMSATSGPLEDFPQGGLIEDERPTS